jgi:hypothetical protein
MSGRADSDPGKVIRDSLKQYPLDEEIELFSSWFKNRFGKNLCAVIFFGSCLSEKSKSETSFKDFIVIVDKYRRTSKNPVKWLSHWILPPDLFHLEIEKQGKKHECKYYLLTLKQLLDAVSERAKDLYVLGRLSKKIAVIYQRDPEIFEQIAKAQESAMKRASELALAFLEQFNLEQFIKAVMRLSYLAETRLEDDRKIESIYQAHLDFYQTVYQLILDGFVERQLVARIAGNEFRIVPEKIPIQRAELDLFLIKSRKRFKARWPKMIITVDNWLEQLLAKLERTWGVKIDIPAWERPIILITGWRHYFRLKREGKIREHKAGN